MPTDEQIIEAIMQALNCDEHHARVMLAHSRDEAHGCDQVVDDETS